MDSTRIMVGWSTPIRARSRPCRVSAGFSTEVTKPSTRPRSSMIGMACTSASHGILASARSRSPPEQRRIGAASRGNSTPLSELLFPAMSWARRPVRYRTFSSFQTRTASSFCSAMAPRAFSTRLRRISA